MRDGGNKLHRRGGKESGRNNLDDVSLLMGRRLLRSVRGGVVSYVRGYIYTRSKSGWRVVTRGKFSSLREEDGRLSRPFLFRPVTEDRATPFLNCARRTLNGHEYINFNGDHVAS